METIAMTAGRNALRRPAVRRYPPMIVAPIAPIAPAWFTVAMPARIDPSTARMRVSGGMRASATVRKNRPSIRPSYGTGGALFGLSSAWTRM